MLLDIKTTITVNRNPKVIGLLKQKVTSFEKPRKRIIRNVQKRVFVKILKRMVKNLNFNDFQSM